MWLFLIIALKYEFRNSGHAGLAMYDRNLILSLISEKISFIKSEYPKYKIQDSIILFSI